MTAEEFLRELALRVEEAVVRPNWNPDLVIRLTSSDAERFLDLTGVRVE